MQGPLIHSQSNLGESVFILEKKQILSNKKAPLRIIQDKSISIFQALKKHQTFQSCDGSIVMVEWDTIQCKII